MTAGHFLLIFKTEAGSESALGTLSFQLSILRLETSLIHIHNWLANPFIFYFHLEIIPLFSPRHTRPRGFPRDSP